MDDVTLDCATCGSRATLPQDGPQLVEQARAFFTQHAECATSVDLTGHRLVGWTLPPAPAPAAWG